MNLSADDAEIMLKEARDFLERPCPGCGVLSTKFEFEKIGFTYVRCVECHSLFTSPAPIEKNLNWFYRQSKSSDYWGEVFSPAVAEVRREQIIAPRARKVLKLIGRFGVGGERFIDVGAGAGIFLQEISRLKPDAVVRAVEPSHPLVKKCRGLGIETFEGVVQEARSQSPWAGYADVVTSFEVIEHVLSPMEFVSGLADLTRPGGLVFFTGLCGDGFDIITLGKDSKAVSPPHHLNFLSHAGVSALLKRCGLDEIQFSTPGRLDLDIVSNTLKETPDLNIGSFEKWIALYPDSEIKNAFQEFLAKHNLSSHMWVIARKPE